MNFRGSKSRRPEASLDMTPLIDIVFLLLVFFLLTTTFSRPTPSQEETPLEEAVIDVDLAKSAAGEGSAPTQKLTVFLDAEGLIYLGSELPIAPNELKKQLQEKLKNGEEPVVDVKADKRASHGAVVDLLGLIEDAGVETVNIVIQKGE